MDTVALCLHTGVKKLETFVKKVLLKLVFDESLLFHYIMINIGYNEKKIGFHYTIMV